MKATKSISTGELYASLDEPSQVVIDLRPMPAYNGWRLGSETRGGHIPGALSLPQAWIDGYPPDQLKGIMESKGASTDKRIVLYASANDDLTPAAHKLASLGFEHVLIYSAGIEAWSAEAELPLLRLPHYQRLVYPGWLHSLLTNGAAAEMNGNRFALFHVNFGVPQEYELAHLPGAAYLDSNFLEDPLSWNRREVHELEAALLALGITHDTTVILYGRDTTPPEGEQWPGRNAGQIAAMRAGAILMYAGVEDVRILDGGFDAWVQSGYTVERQRSSPKPVGAFGVPIPQHPDYFIDLDGAKALLGDPNGALVSIRTWAEYIGDESGYNYIGPRGRIRGAVWGNCGTDAYHMQVYRNPDNSMRAYHEIERNWLAAGITPEKRVAFYCGTGWRASETFFYAFLMGWKQIAIYDGGWYEWSKDPQNNPIASGAP